MNMNMKKLALFWAILAPSLAFGAPITTPWIAPGGGISGSSKMLAPGSTLDDKTLTEWGSAIDANAAAAAAALTTASAAIPLAQKGAASGVAPLDSNSLLSSPLFSGSNLIGDWSSHVMPDWFSQGYESNLMGGYTQLGANYMPRSLFIQSDPYGNYSTGCGLGVSMMGAVGNQQFPISEADFRAGASSVVAAAGYDTVASCILTGNQPARFVLTASSYTATSVVLTTALTAAQAAMIHPGMYITTNSPNTSLTLTATDGELAPKNLYAGFVSAQPRAGDTSISVYGWDVPGHGTGVSGQIPQTTTLDTVWSARTSPTVFLGGGAGGSAFMNNWFASVDAGNLTPSTTNQSLIHQITPLEVDLNIVNGTAPDNSVNWQGISMNAGNQPAALTTDSRQVFLGGNINHHLEVNGGCGNWDYNSIASGGFVDMPTPCGLSTSGVTDQVMSAWTSWISGANKITMMLETSMGNPTATTGWEQAVMHLGPTVDGNRVQSGDYGGSKQGDIEWNQGANYGSISLCGFATNCGLEVFGDGTVHASKAATFTAPVNIVNGIYAVDSTGANLVQFYPTSSGDWTVGTSVSGGGNVRGVNGYYGASATLTGTMTSSSVSTGTVNTSGQIKSTGGLDVTGDDAYIEDGHILYIKPATLDNGLQAGWCAPDSYTLETCTNIGAWESLMSHGDIRSSAGGRTSSSAWHPDGHGNWYASDETGDGGTAGGGAVRQASYTLASLPTTNETDGNHLWCSDCKLNNITGVEVYWHASAAKWTDSQNGTLAN